MLLLRKMKIERKTLKAIVLGAIGGAILSGIAAYVGYADHSPYGRKSCFPPALYGRSIDPKDLDPKLSAAYLDGYVEDGIIIDVLEGRMLNALFEPESLETDRRY